MEKNVGKIYIIKNTANDKVYVGQTITPLEIRWKNHLSNAYNVDSKDSHSMIIYLAMRKYGVENFYIEILEDNIPKNQLNKREAYWIKYYNSVRPNGYNILDGEQTNELFYKNPIYQLDKKTLKIIDKFDSEAEAEFVTGIKAGYISRVIRGVQLTTGGYRWCKAKDYDDYIKNPPTQTNGKNYYNKDYNFEINRTSKTILQIDPKTNQVIKEWYNGAGEISKEINKAVSGIYSVIHGNRKTCGGYIWKYKN